MSLPRGFWGHNRGTSTKTTRHRGRCRGVTTQKKPDLFLLPLTQPVPPPSETVLSVRRLSPPLSVAPLLSPLTYSVPCGTRDVPVSQSYCEAVVEKGEGSIKQGKKNKTKPLLSPELNFQSTVKRSYDPYECDCPPGSLTRNDNDTFLFALLTEVWGRSAFGFSVSTECQLQHRRRGPVRGEPWFPDVDTVARSQWDVSSGV